jgi:hypothetical protein
MQKWSDEDDLYLFTPAEYERIPDGTVLTCIDNTTSVKGKDYIDDDTRFGHIAYGVKDPWNHPLKDLFLIFKIIE